MRFVFRWIVRIVLVLLWLAVSIVLGGVVLSVKETMGINIFSTTGYHSFEKCLASESRKALQEKAAWLRKEK